MFENSSTKFSTKGRLFKKPAGSPHYVYWEARALYHVYSFGSQLLYGVAQTAGSVKVVLTHFSSSRQERRVLEKVRP